MCNIHLKKRKKKRWPCAHPPLSLEEDQESIPHHRKMKILGISRTFTSNVKTYRKKKNEGIKFPIQDFDLQPSMREYKAQGRVGLWNWASIVY